MDTSQMILIAITIALAIYLANARFNLIVMAQAAAEEEATTQLPQKKRKPKS